MTFPPPSPQRANEAIEAIWAALDPRLASNERRSFAELRARGAPSTVPWEGSLVLAGHRASGKSSLLPRLSDLLRVEGLDLDLELERRHGRPLRSWVKEDAASFRQAERALFQELSGSPLIAVGGGFLALHGDLLRGHTPVVIPISFPTYRERLLADDTRPRLRPELSPEEEIAQVFQEREVAHGRSGALPLAAFLAGLPEELYR